MNALHVRKEGADLTRAIATALEEAPTAVAIPSDEAMRFTESADAARFDMSKLRALICVGRSLTVDERGQLGEAVQAAGATNVSIAVAAAPAEGRVLWGECAVPAGRTETFGLHTFPDLDLIEVVSPDTGVPLGEEQPGEIVITPLQFRGGGAPRWRTGDLAVGGMTTKPCPNCGRTVPRVGPAMVRGAWQHVLALNGTQRWVDLREAGAAAAERADQWQVEVLSRDGHDELFVYVAAAPESERLIDLFEDLGRVRATPTQIVLGSEADVAARIAEAPGPWPRYWDKTGAQV
jgi:phenylacetate-coenzyme A ligase PaaK-like adenylate-forming protein